MVTANIVFRLKAGAESVTIRGGGADTSNCTKDETSKTIPVKNLDMDADVSFVARSGGSCSIEPSYSYFTFNVKNSKQEVIASWTLLVYGFDPVKPYELRCDTPFGAANFNMTCRPDSILKAVLTQSDARPRLRGSQYGDLSFILDGPGPVIRVQGGGDESNCTRDETDVTKAAGKDLTVIPFGFDAKSSGSCALERSYSYFRIRITGKNAAGRDVSGEAKVFLGQAFAQLPYTASCDSSSSNITCQRIDSRSLQLVVK